ncbi:MAG TPA: hypothetical protein VFX57_01910 [Sulfuricurvum sp.]|nr:hypothetical protein [Sulfuricurvum sp.]
MSKNEVREGLISKYLEPQKNKGSLYKTSRVLKKTGNTLDDFYTEVHAKTRSYGVKNVYYGKNADEIEIIMLQNRKLIEVQLNKKR